ncbi:hypothetical protein U4I65_02380 [Stenotrophomonas maltophilia]|uniref:hypothetical protein n=1 Tax=Stenotrophomonas maltophilia TaxID=40324 RepID=UPI002ACC89C4|nr:hypothetical protein [Stenotrophomonas maltophilia]MDZ5813883.1 hypothetical protein [Stenotrophomonas maltophilia]
MSSKHTPGPWGIEQTDDTNWIGFMRPDGRKVELIVCTTQRDNFFKPDVQDKNDANARLIAAAPELLEALKDAVCALDCCGKDYPAAEKARAAIAKATGGAQ